MIDVDLTPFLEYWIRFANDWGILGASKSLDNLGDHPQGISGSFGNFKDFLRKNAEIFLEILKFSLFFLQF